MCYECDDEVLPPCSTNQPDCEGHCYGFDCIDCGANTLHTDEYYMVEDSVWKLVTINEDGRGMLCIGCLEFRLGRLLTTEDFPPLPINRGVFPMSARLLQRITGGNR
jgi:hypothetical protein